MDGLTGARDEDIWGGFFLCWRKRVWVGGVGGGGGGSDSGGLGKDTVVVVDVDAHLRR